MDKKVAVKIAEAKVRVAQRKLAEAKKALKESEIALEPLTKEILTTAIEFTKGYITGDMSLGAELKETLRQHIEGCMFVDDDDEEASVAEAERIIAMKSKEVEALAKVADPAGYAELETELASKDDGTGDDEDDWDDEDDDWDEDEELDESAAKKALNEDVNNYTFKDLFGKDFDEVLKDACEQIAKIPEEFDTYGWETVSEVLENGSDPELIQELDDNAGAEVEHIVASTVCALLDKNLDLAKFNDLRTKLGLEPIEESEKEDEK